MHKATIVNTVSLTGELDSSEKGESGLQALMDTVKRTQPDLLRYSKISTWTTG